MTPQQADQIRTACKEAVERGWELVPGKTLFEGACCPMGAMYLKLREWDTNYPFPPMVFSTVEAELVLETGDVAAIVCGFDSRDDDGGFENEMAYQLGQEMRGLAV